MLIILVEVLNVIHRHSPKKPAVSSRRKYQDIGRNDFSDLREKKLTKPSGACRFPP
jgi:hypothetical protein